MRKWKASMPREMAREGAADVVLAYRQANGDRFELECTLSKEDSEALMAQAIQMMKAHKGNKNG